MLLTVGKDFIKPKLQTHLAGEKAQEKKTQEHRRAVIYGEKKQRTNTETKDMFTQRVQLEKKL